MVDRLPVQRISIHSDTKTFYKIKRINRMRRCSLMSLRRIIQALRGVQRHWGPVRRLIRRIRFNRVILPCRLSRRRILLDGVHRIINPLRTLILLRRRRIRMEIVDMVVRYRDFLSPSSAEVHHLPLGDTMSVRRLPNPIIIQRILVTKKCTGRRIFLHLKIMPPHVSMTEKSPAQGV
jgi:hypothetical protein